jgi:uncharacterized FlaG/YvyC family protein
MDIKPVSTFDGTYSNKVNPERVIVEMKTNVEAVKPLIPNSIDRLEKIEKSRKHYGKVFEWYTDEDGEFRVKIRDGSGKVVQYIPPETLAKMLEDLKGNLINEIA